MLRNILNVLDPNSAEAEFGVSLIDTDLHTIAILIELKRNPGMSVSNAARHYINEVNFLYDLEPKTTRYVELYEGRQDPCLIHPRFENNGLCHSVSFSPIPEALKEFVLTNMAAE